MAPLHITDMKATKILLTDGKWYSIKQNSFKVEELTWGSGSGDVVISFTCLDEKFFIPIDAVKGYIHGS